MPIPEEDTNTECKEDHAGNDQRALLVLPFLTHIIESSIVSSCHEDTGTCALCDKITMLMLKIDFQFPILEVIDNATLKVPFSFSASMPAGIPLHEIANVLVSQCDKKILKK